MATIYYNSMRWGSSSGTQYWPYFIAQQFSTLSPPDSHIVSQWLHDRYQKSNLLAQQVHHSLLDTVRMYNKTVVDRRTKHAISQVLLGTTMPVDFALK